MCHLILGDTKGILTMFVRKKKYPSGNIGVIVVEKIGGKMKELATIGVAYNEDEVETLSMKRKNGFTERIHVAILSSICSVMSVKRVTASVKKSAVFCPTSATSF